MAQKQYVAKPEKVDADQYAAATMPATTDPTAWPWVCNCTRNPLFAGGAPHVHGRDGQQALTEGDWIVALVVNPAKYWALTNAEFTEVYGPGGGQPLPAGSDA
jgi:hypothetical protein